MEYQNFIFNYFVNIIDQYDLAIIIFAPKFGRLVNFILIMVSFRNFNEKLTKKLIIYGNPSLPHKN